MRSLKHLNKYLWKNKRRLSLGIVFIIISKLFAVYPAQIVRHSFNKVADYLQIIKLFKSQESIEILSQDIGKILLIFSGLVIVFAILNGVFLFLTRQTIIIMSRFIEYDLKNEIYEQYQKLSASFYKKNNTGDLMNRISEDVGKVRMYVGPAIMYTINLIVLFVIVLITMLKVNVELTLYSVLPLPVLSFIIYYVSNIINRKSAKVQAELSSISTFAQETFSGIRIIKSYDRLDEFSDRFLQNCNNYRFSALSLVKTNALFHPSMILLVGMSTILTVFMGGILSIRGELSPGNIAEFVIYVNMLTWPVAALGWVTSLVQQAAASQERINEFLRVPEEIKEGELKPLDLQGCLSFQNVILKYENSDFFALENVSFHLSKGKTLGVLGKTGSGKTTIANLICRQYNPTAGSISIDEHDLKNIKAETLKNILGYVPQDVYLFSDTITNNIAFSSNDSEQSVVGQVEEVSEVAHVHDNIIDLSDKYETLLGERGVNLSGGQKQRISIARALFKKPKILILDDCLSAVDTETEAIILKNIQEYTDNITTIIMSHRISTLKFADEIIVLDDGKIIERGTHDALLDLKGEYAQVFQKQLLDVV